MNRSPTLTLLSCLSSSRPRPRPSFLSLAPLPSSLALAAEAKLRSRAAIESGSLPSSMEWLDEKDEEERRLKDGDDVSGER